MSTPTLTPAPPGLPASSGPADVIRWQRQCVQTGAYELLGKVWMIVFEAAKDAQVPSRSVTDYLGTRIEFYNDMGGPSVVGPRIAQTGPKGSLLVLDPLTVEEPKGSGQYVVGLPSIPDPTWKPPVPTPEQLTGDKPYVPPKAPMIPQRLVDRNDGWGGRARAQIRDDAGKRYLVCGPIKQIIVRPMDKQNRVLPNGLIYRCLPSTSIAGASATLMELLVDTDTGEAFFYGGSFTIDDVG